MEIKFPSNLTDRKYSQFARSFDDRDEVARSAESGRIVIYWDDTADPDDTPVRQVGFLQGVSYSRKGAKYTIFTQSGYTLTYTNVIPIAEEHCPRVFVKDDGGAAVGRLIGLQYDEDKRTHKFLVRLLPFVPSVYTTLTADKLMFVDNAPMGVGTEETNG